MKRFEVVAAWDPDAKVWWGTNDELPMTTEAPTIEEFERQAAEIAQEMAEENGLVAPGEKIELRVLRDPSAA